MINLILDKDYYIKFNHGLVYTFNIRCRNNKYYLYFIRVSNDYLFDLFKINKYEFTEKVLGYYDDGVWPFCITQEDCEKLLYELLKKASQLGYEFTCSFSYEKFDLFWDD